MLHSRRRITGSAVVIVGASSGIGRAAAHAFARHGAQLTLAARSAGDLEAVAAECRSLGAPARPVPTDIRDPDAVDALRHVAVATYGRIDTWVNAAAVLVAGEFGTEPIAEVEALVDVNVAGTVFGARAALDQFRAQRNGVLIDVSSMLGVVPNPLVPLYVMSKYAVRGLSLSLHHAATAWPGVHVCVVLPGPIDTAMFDRAANHTGRRLRSIPPTISPERAAAAIVSCARRPRRQVPVGATSRAVLLGERIAPRCTEWAVARYSAAMLVSGDETADTHGAVLQPAPPERVQGGYRHGAVRRRIGDAVGQLLARR